MPTLLSRLTDRLADSVRVLRSAARVSGAVETGRRPSEDDLRRLGLNAAAFAAIRF